MTDSRTTDPRTGPATGPHDNHAHHDNHGQTPAAWTAVSLIMIAFLLGTIAVVVGNWPLFWIGGVGLAVVGGAAGKVMSMMGYGAAPQAHS